MQAYFSDKQTKDKYYYKIFDLDENKLEICVDESLRTINEWNGSEYEPDFNVNILVDDQVKLTRSVTNNFKETIILAP